MSTFIMINSLNPLIMKDTFLLLITMSSLFAVMFTYAHVEDYFYKRRKNPKN